MANPNAVKLPFSWTTSKVRSNLGMIPTFTTNRLQNGSAPGAQAFAPPQVAEWQLPLFPMSLRGK